MDENKKTGARPAFSDLEGQFMPRSESRDDGTAKAPKAFPIQSRSPRGLKGYSRYDQKYCSENVTPADRLTPQIDVALQSRQTTATKKPARGRRSQIWKFNSGRDQYFAITGPPQR